VTAILQILAEVRDGGLGFSLHCDIDPEARFLNDFLKPGTVLQDSSLDIFFIPFRNFLRTL
jgi:hypothetical protein